MRATGGRWAALIVILVFGGGPAAGGHAADGLLADDSRWYVTPLLGASWATLSSDDDDAIINRNLFTAGAAIGRAIPAAGGQWRLEVESLYRDAFTLNPPADSGFSGSFTVSQNWSVLGNVWRDFALTRQIGLYAGGGIGGGGYRPDYDLTDGDVRVTGLADMATFAWQAGGGVIYAVSDRITLDLGYRFYGVAADDLTFTLSEDGVPIGRQNEPIAFSASELLLGVRIYEPFRRWRTR